MTIALWTPDAVTDLEKIVDYIAEQENRRSVARKVYDSLKAHCDDYAQHYASGHELGTKRPDLGEGYRILTHQRWVVIFRPYQNTILVIAVLDGSQDFDALVRSRNSDWDL